MLKPFKVTRRALLLGVGVTVAAMMASTAPATAETVETLFPTPPTTFGDSALCGDRQRLLRRAGPGS